MLNKFQFEMFYLLKYNNNEINATFLKLKEV